MTSIAEPIEGDPPPSKAEILQRDKAALMEKLAASPTTWFKLDPVFVDRCTEDLDYRFGMSLWPFGIPGIEAKTSEEGDAYVRIQTQRITVTPSKRRRGFR